MIASKDPRFPAMFKNWRFVENLENPERSELVASNSEGKDVLRASLKFIPEHCCYEIRVDEEFIKTVQQSQSTCESSLVSVGVGDWKAEDNLVKAQMALLNGERVRVAHSFKKEAGGTFLARLRRFDLETLIHLLNGRCLGPLVFDEQTGKAERLFAFWDFELKDDLNKGFEDAITLALEPEPQETADVPVKL